jgi:hypothetical protein
LYSVSPEYFGYIPRTLSLINFVLEFVISEAQASHRGLKMNEVHQLWFYTSNFN